MIVFEITLINKIEVGEILKCLFYQMNVNDFVKDPEAQDINLKAQITTCKSWLKFFPHNNSFYGIPRFRQFCKIYIIASDVYHYQSKSSFYIYVKIPEDEEDEGFAFVYLVIILMSSILLIILCLIGCLIFGK